MISQTSHDLVLAVYPQTRGFAFALFEGWLTPVDWGIHEARGPEKNARCLTRINSLLELHMPNVVVLQDMMSDRGSRRAPRIQELNNRIAELADLRGMLVHKYQRAKVIDYFADLGASTKQKIAETIAKHVPALALYVPPPRKPWMSEDARIGIFEAAALAWMYFRGAESGRQAA
jgi:hypothetical protein